MKRLVAILIVLSMLGGIFTGCGSKEKTIESSPKENGQIESNSKESSQTEKKQTENKGTEAAKSTEAQVQENPGSELSTFMNSYTDAKTKVWDTMSKKFEEQQNLAFMMGSLGFAFADLEVLDIVFFDTLTVKDGDSFKGKLMFTDIDAWKKVKGDIIEFGYDFTYNEDKNNNKNGDREVTNGKFDKKNNSLYYERFTERNKEKINRIIVEVVKNSGSSYSSQIIMSDTKGKDDKGDGGLSGYLTWFDGEDIISFMTQNKSAGSSFKYNSILNKKNVKPEEMASGMDIVSKVSFIKGAASFESGDSK